MANLVQKIVYSGFAMNTYSRLMAYVRQKVISYDVPEIRQLMYREDVERQNELRLNLVVPSVSERDVFGGIATSIVFFHELVECLGCKSRIITIDRVVDLKETISLDDYVLVDSNKHSNDKHQLVDMTVRDDRTLEVGSNDIFMATSWWSAYILEALIKWQSSNYNQSVKPLIYFIQDFEPGFYAWSSKYVMAESTYKMDIPIYAILNSKQLFDYFNSMGYSFEKSWYFEPVINSKLKDYLLKVDNYPTRKNQILIYGRPGTARNSFELIVSALKEWSLKYSNSKEWTILSAGEAFDDISLGNGIKIKSLGKLSIEEYAKVMLESKVGISLMVSPHPSYPPLEMSTFGIKVITNAFLNKDLSSFNSNIISIDRCSASSISDLLIDACNTSDNKVIMDNNYCNVSDVYSQICEQLTILLN